MGRYNWAQQLGKKIVSRLQQVIPLHDSHMFSPVNAMKSYLLLWANKTGYPKMSLWLED